MYWFALMPAVCQALPAFDSTVVWACSSCCHFPAHSSVDCPVSAAYSSSDLPMLPNSFWMPPTFCS